MRRQNMGGALAGRIEKLDAEGIARSRLFLIVADDLCCPDHALSARHEAAFVAPLGADVQR